MTEYEIKRQCTNKRCDSTLKNDMLFLRKKKTTNVPKALIKRTPIDDRKKQPFQMFPTLRAIPKKKKKK